MTSSHFPRSTWRGALMAMAAIVAGSGAHARETSAAPADLVLRNGRVLTVDAADHVEQAVAVRDGRIVYVGSDAGVVPFISGTTRVVDLHGGVAMPGLFDGHMHPLGGGAALMKCNLNYAPLTVTQFQQRIQACLDKESDAGPDKLLEVVNWMQYSMTPASVEVSYTILDQLKTSRPIAVTSSFYHSTLVNSRAMKLAGITAKTPDPVAGKVTRDATGNPTGLLEDSAQRLLVPLRVAPTAAETRKAAIAALAAIREKGITSFLDAAAGEESVAVFAGIASEGGLTARANFAPVVEVGAGGDPDKASAPIIALARQYPRRPLVATPGIAVGTAKLFLDGVINSPALTGSMLKPYLHNVGSPQHPHWEASKNAGPDPYFPPERLNALLDRFARAGIDPHMHADGDRAVRTALDAIAAMRRAHPGVDIRPAIAHDEIVDPADFSRYRELGAIPVLSFQWEKPASDTVDGARDYLGPVRYPYIEPAGFLAAAGARIAYGSDWPVDPLDPWLALQVAVTRANPPGGDPRYAGRLGKDPGLTIRQALRAMTIDAAYSLHAERDAGSIEVGKLADIIVVDRDILSVPATDIAGTTVLTTIVGGKVVFDRKAPAQ